LNLYHQPVILGQEHGFSYGGTDGEAFSLNAPVASSVKDAQVQGYEFLLRSRLSYGAIARSMNSKASFESATKLVVANMLKSFAKRLEFMLFYGQKGLADVDNTSDVSGSVLTVPAGEWAPGHWSGAVGMELVSIDISTPTDQDEIAVTAVDLDARAITFSGSLTNTGSSTDARWFHKGAVDASGNSLEFLGLEAIMTNTGTLFNISSSTYDMWKSIEFSAGSAALSFAKIQKAIARLVEKGRDSCVVCIVHPRAWYDLWTDQAALREYDQSYKSEKMENGAQGLVFHSQNGKVEIRPCNYVKEQHAFILPLEEVMRIGSTDITFKLPGSNDKFFRELTDNAGYELRAYSDQSLFTSSPARLAIITDIVNTL
jgi:hypothetical protein